ncbi:hypothetical protein [Acetobacter sp.]|uniref:hypothetical protein n=1 Tax=Acetobacter sp. TaxID=440 RepID=UPI0025BAA34C|nr:hypothetical protein [Acetobacter sp.]MCH4090690.1 hypothetical protein [Acetobacter sp.]MCI1300133.1 hypothetical protein [Acetobacter sp.]MCI1316551.1 hypothetical protein [Acetobacter sp.]
MTVASSTASRLRRNVRNWLVPGVLVCLSGCAAETGRMWNDTDVSCLRKQMGSAVHLSFPLAANTCQRMTNHGFIIGEAKAKPIPLELHNAPDLQAMAEEYGYSYSK